MLRAVCRFGSNTIHMTQPIQPTNTAHSGVTSHAKRVLHFNGTNVAGTGVDTFITQLAEAQRRFNVVAHIGCDSKDRDDYLATVREQGFPIWTFPQPGAITRSLPGKLTTVFKQLRRTLSLSWYLLRNRIDVLHVHAVALSSLEAHLASLLTRTPIVVTHHATIEWFRPYWTRQTDMILWLEKRRTRQVACPYPAAAQELRELGMSDDQLHIVPFCADETRFNGSITLPKAGEPIILITVSRLVEGKGHVELLDAIASLRDKLPQLRLHIAGDGPARATIEQHIAKLNLGNQVKMLGRIPHAAVPDLMRQSHVIVLASYMGGETFPVCLLEAMCIGMPCIGTRWFGIPDIIADGKTGFVVEPRDAKGLAVAIDKLVSDPDFFAQTSAQAAQRAQAEFTGHAVAGRYAQLYDQACQKT